MTDRHLEKFVRKSVTQKTLNQNLEAKCAARTWLKNHIRLGKPSKKKNSQIWDIVRKWEGGSEKSQTFFSKFSLDIFQ